MTKSDPLSASTLPDKCTAPAPEQPPLVKWAVEEARATRSRCRCPATAWRYTCHWPPDELGAGGRAAALHAYRGDVVRWQQHTINRRRRRRDRDRHDGDGEPSVHFAPPTPSTLPSPTASTRHRWLPLPRCTWPVPRATTGRCQEDRPRLDGLFFGLGQVALLVAGTSSCLRVPSLRHLGHVPIVSYAMESAISPNAAFLQAHLQAAAGEATSGEDASRQHQGC